MKYVIPDSMLSARCNVLSNDYTIISYTGARTRETWIKQEDQWYLYRTETSNNDYNLSGYNCIDVRNLNYKPEVDIYFQVISMALIGVALFMIYRLAFRFLRK